METVQAQNQRFSLTLDPNNHVLKEDEVALEIQYKKESDKEVLLLKLSDLDLFQEVIKKFKRKNWIYYQKLEAPNEHRSK